MNNQEIENRIRKLKKYGFEMAESSFILKFGKFVASVTFEDIRNLSDDDFENCFTEIIERSKL